MKNSVNNKIIEDVLASFKMDYIDVPVAVIDVVKGNLEINKEKKFILVKKEKSNDFGRK